MTATQDALELRIEFADNCYGRLRRFGFVSRNGHRYAVYEISAPGPRTDRRKFGHYLKRNGWRYSREQRPWGWVRGSQ